MQTYTIKPAGGFTLIEILVVIGLLAILAGVVLAAVNPTRQFAQARNAQRVSNVQAILSAVGARFADTQGIFSDGSGCLPIPTDSYRTIGSAGIENSYDLRPCLVPIYIPEIPIDPSMGSNTCTSQSCMGVGESYNTQYSIRQNESTGRVSVCSDGYAETSLGLDGERYCAER